MLRIWKWLAFWLSVLLFSAAATGCGGSSGMTEAQRQDVKMMVGLFQDVGGRVNGSVRAGRPFVAGVIEGFIVIPGVEIDVNGSVDALRGNVKTESRKPKAESAGQGSGTGKPALAAADAAEGP